ncbi:MAG: AAA-like domain-containing protein [Pseudomonadota bacterium]
MVETSNNQVGGTAERRFEVGRHFVVGGVVPVDRPLYLRRLADSELYRLASSGEFVHVFAPRQSGKSSLTARVAERLRNDDRLVAVIDLEQIGSRDDQLDTARWFYSFAFRLLRQLRIKIDLQDWWQDKSILTNRQRLTELFWDVVLSNTDQSVTVFIDSPQSLGALPFADELLGAIDAIHTARAAEPDLARLNFVLLAVAEPETLPGREELSFFAASQRLELPPFTRAELDGLTDWLPLPVDAARSVLDRIHYWTKGQPFLTMKLARRVARQVASGQGASTDVDHSVRHLFGHAQVLDSEPHLGVIRRALLEEMPGREQVLTLYGRIRKGDRVASNRDSLTQRRLLGEGLVLIDDNEQLVVANRIYAMTLTPRWVNDNLPMRLQTTALVAAAAILAVLIPLWYVEILPRGWIATIQNPLVLEDATEAHERMRAWPGHRRQANSLLADYLDRRSRASQQLDEVREFDRLLRELPGTAARADSLTAAYWDREAARRELAADRDGALRSRLSALSVATGRRLQTAQTLVGDDYARLVAVINQTDPIDDAALATDARVLTTLSGGTVRQFDIGAETSLPTYQWQAHALDVFPVISRVPVAGRGRAGRFVAHIDVAHDRVSDLSVRLTGPSGRSVSLAGIDAEVVPGSGLRLSSRDIDVLRVLEQEDVSGGWTLSIVDRRPAIAGTLNGWRLEFARHGDFSAADAPAVLREPTVAPVGRAVLSPAARYVVALPASSDGVAQVWDTATRQAIASLPISSEDRVIGFVLDERVLLVARAQGLVAFALATGDASWSPPIATTVLRSALSVNRQFLAVVGSGADPALTIFDLIEERAVASLPTATELAGLAVASDGTRVAVAYADQTVRLWATDSATPIAEVVVPAAVTALDFNANDRQLLIRSNGGRLSVWDFAAAEPTLVTRRTSGEWAMAIDPNGRRMVVGNAAAGFAVVDADNLTPVVPLLRTANRDEQQLVRFRGGRDTLLLFDPDAGTSRVFRVNDDPDLTAAGVSIFLEASSGSDSDTLTEARIDGTVRFAAPEGAADRLRDRVSYVGHTAPVVQVRQSASGALAASLAADGSVRVWEAAESAPRPYFIRLPTADIVAMRFSSNEQSLLVALPGEVRVFDTATGVNIAARTFDQTVTVGEFLSADRVGVGHDNGLVSVLSVEQSLIGDQYAVSSVAITALTSAVRGRLAIADDSGGLTLVAVDPVDVIPLHKLGEACRELRLSGDSRRIVCRTDNWLLSIPLNAPQAGQIFTQLLPAMRFSPGMKVSRDGLSVTLLGHSASLQRTRVRFDQTAPTRPVETVESELRTWQERLPAFSQP